MDNTITYSTDVYKFENECLKFLNYVKKYANDMYKARVNGKLYASGLTGGLTTKKSSDSTLVKKHNFYGK